MMKRKKTTEFINEDGLHHCYYESMVAESHIIFKRYTKKKENLEGVLAAVLKSQTCCKGPTILEM